MTKGPLEEQDVIETKVVTSKLWHENLVNFNHILETGKIPISTEIGTGKRDEFIRVNWNAKDAFTDAFRDIEQRVAQRVQMECADLLENKNWSRGQRQQWEEWLATIVSDEVANTKGLGEYRTVKNGGGSARDISSLNQLSDDIKNGTQNKRFDCLIQSVVEGCLNQKMENRFLGADAKNYFFMTGGVTFNISPKQDGRHTAILTPSGSVIESTMVEGNDNQPYGKKLYVRSNSGSNTLQDIANGKPFYGVDNSVYGQPNGPNASTIGQKGVKVDAPTATPSRLDRIFQNAEAEGYVRVPRDDVTATAKPARPAIETPVKVSRPAPPPEPVGSATVNKSNPVLNIQEGLQNVKVGGAPVYQGGLDGGWNPKLNESFEQFVVMAQMTDDYANYCKKHPGVSVDGVYGPGTKMAMQKMADRGEIPQSLVNNIDKLNREHKLTEYYDGPHDVLGAMQNAKEFMQQQNRLSANSTLTSSANYSSAPKI